MMILLLLMLCHAALAQYEPDQNAGFESLLTPQFDEACGYASCLPVKPGWLNVHLVPQTHSELGHGYTFDQHFTGEDPPFPKNNVNMKRILDAILTELWNDSQRRFTLSDTAYLFHWWKNRHPSVHRMMYELIRQGRLTIVGGGLSISDEASTSYHAIIDQFTYSLRKLNETFRGCARPLVAWAADVYGHSREFTSLMAQMGYDALFINPISYDEEVARMRRKSLEFLWRGSDDLGPSTDLFTHNLFDGYWSPPGFCFSKLCSDPLLVTSSQLFSDVRERVDKFIETTLYRQAPIFETRNIMVIMGHRKAYSDANIWFANIEKLIAYTNWRAMRRNLNVTLFYSNPACYLAAVNDENPELETKQDDFFPYVHDKDSYTVGMYTSRPTFKYLIREAHVYLQIAKQIQITASMGPFTNLFEDFNWILGVVQDHSVATGVMRERVRQYYTSRLDTAVTKATGMISKSLTKLRASPNHVEYYRCQFNISSCTGTRFIKYSVTVYNPLGWQVTMPVRLPVYPTNSQFKVYDVDGEEVKSETIRLPDTILNIKDRPTADYELVFIAERLPPVGFRSYYIEAQFYKAKILYKREGEGLDYEDIEKEYQANRSIRYTLRHGKNTHRQVPYRKNTLHDMSIGVEKSKREDKTSKGVTNPYQEMAGSAATEVLKGTANNYMSNMLNVDTNPFEPSDTTTYPEVLLPMLKDFLQKSKVYKSLDLTDKEDMLSANDLDYETTTKAEVLETLPTTENDVKINFQRYKKIDDIMIKPDIRVPIIRRTTRPNIHIDIRERSYLRTPTTTEADIEVATRVSEINDIRIADPDIEVPITRKTKSATRVLEFTDNTSPESLAIVPVRTTPTVTRSSTTDAMFVVPMQKLNFEKMLGSGLLSENEDVITTTEFGSNVEGARRLGENDVSSTEANSDKENENIERSTTEEAETFILLEPTTQKLPELWKAPDNGTQANATFKHATNTALNALNVKLAGATHHTPIQVTRTIPPRPVFRTNEKYFKVEDNKRLFIGNKYVRLNLDDKKRVASLFLSNGVRINLSLFPFHYVSDDPSKFDIRTTPRRDIKPPGAYIFRPIDPYIIRTEDNYDIRIIKTDIVEEMRVTFSKWTSVMLRLYVDSPVIEVHWLVGPVPTDDGLGKEVFIRYQTDLVNNGVFYTDSNGRQTIKRIRGARATYTPAELNPITGNLYPVTSKIHIEDLKKNIRFSVFNDRSQSGGSLIDGTIDLMLHRRILTDDIGFGAFLNETENDEPIRVSGVHYLYLTKASRNKIFEKKLAKEIALQPRVLTSDHTMYTSDMKKQFYDSKNEFSALHDTLPLGVHLLSLERISTDQLLLRLENYFEKADVTSDGVRYVPLRTLFKDIKIMWLKETLLAGNMYKDRWEPTQWRKKTKFYRRFNDVYGGANGTLEDKVEKITDELGGRGEEVKSETIRLPDTILNIKDRPTADYELVFIAERLPPVGFRSYYIEAQFYKAKILYKREGEGLDYEDIEKEYQANRSIRYTLRHGKNTHRQVPYRKNTLHDMSIGVEKSKREDKTSKGVTNPYQEMAGSAATEVLKGTANNYMSNMLNVDTNPFEPTDTTTYPEVLLPMLKDFLQKSKVYKSLDLTDKEDMLSANDLDYETTTKAEVLETLPTTENDVKINFQRYKKIDDIMIKPDIRVPVIRRTTRPNIHIDIRERSYLRTPTTTEADIEVATRVSEINDIRIADPDIEVPITRKTKSATRVLEFTDNTSPESLAIVPVRTTPTVTRSSTADAMFVVPMQKLNFEKMLGSGLLSENEDVITTTEFGSNVEGARRLGENDVSSTEANSDKENENIERSTTEEAETFILLEPTTQKLPELWKAPDNGTQANATFKHATNTALNALNVKLAGATHHTPIQVTRTIPPRPVFRTNDKYFKVEDNKRLFIGNKYVRLNLDDKKRVASLFLSNGVRINLSLFPFHYVSDDPSKFDIRTTPRRDIKPPGAYIFRPIDPYIIRTEDNYDIRIIKTDIVEEMRVTFSKWTSVMLRLYVDSPVIEVHWLVGPVPTDDGLGKEVFIRYQTDLVNNGVFYTDSNGRQTIKRIRGARATYTPAELNPITGNLYPVTSKIHIEDLNKNIRFSVFNDRSQAGGSLIDGTIDLMLHRRILTDDIGFGAFLNETENDEPIRVSGVHYLYLTKASRNKIFEKKLAKEIALQPRVLTSDHTMYTSDMKKQFYDSKNEFSALHDTLPLGVHLLSLERISTDQLLLRLENYFEKADVTSDGVRYVPLRTLFKDIKIMWLKETLLAGNMYKDRWEPTQWRKKTKFYRRFNDVYGGANGTLEDKVEKITDELGGRGIRLAPQQIRTFIVKYKYVA